MKNEGCWDGAKEYPDTWCQFGCAVQVRRFENATGCIVHVWLVRAAVSAHQTQLANSSPLSCPSSATLNTPLCLPQSQELDPTGKFNGAGTGARNIWQWAATRGGQAVPFASCCGPQGFLPQCQCARRASCA